MNTYQGRKGKRGCSPWNRRTTAKMEQSGLQGLQLPPPSSNIIKTSRQSWSGAETARMERPFGLYGRRSKDNSIGNKTKEKTQDVNRRDILEVVVLLWAQLHLVSTQWTFEHDAALYKEHAGVVQDQFSGIHRVCGMPTVLPESDCGELTRIIHSGDQGLCQAPP